MPAACQVLWWYGTAYAIVLWSIAGATGQWVYPMMNWDIPFSLIAYVLLPILPFIAFLIWCACCPLHSTRSSAVQLQSQHQLHSLSFPQRCHVNGLRATPQT